MADYDSPPVVISLQKVVRPLQDRTISGGVIFKANDDEIHAAGAKQVVPVIVISSVVTTVVAFPGKVADSKVVIVKICSSSDVSFRRLVVIANRNTVRDAEGQKRGNRIFQCAQRGPGI